MHYIPLTDDEEKSLMNEIKIKDFNELIKVIPNNIRLKNKLGLGDSLSELEIAKELKQLSNENNIDLISFLGNGVYDHFIPAAVDFISSRSEYYTAYTPYQAEVSQGTLQYLYEYQTMICELSGMDISNASLYDGASAVAEACSMAIAITGNKRILYSNLLNLNYVQVIKSYFNGLDVDFIELKNSNGITNISKIDKLKNNVAAVIIQSPNRYGLIESWENVSKILSNKDSLLIAVSDPMSLSILKPPGLCGADIFVGEGQTIGNTIHYGGPLIGLMAIKEEYKRRMPGRIIGRTIDKNNKIGYVLTLQTREQHIRRANATSNICTNQGLLALKATIYLSLLGKRGLPMVANLCFQKSQYAASKISKLKCYKIKYGNTFIKEFIVETNHSASQVVKHCKKHNLLINTLQDDKSNKLLQIAVTEKRTVSEIDKLVLILDSF